MSGFSGPGSRGGVTDCNGYEIYLRGNENVLKLDSSAGFTALLIY